MSCSICSSPNASLYMSCEHMACTDCLDKKDPFCKSCNKKVELDADENKQKLLKNIVELKQIEIQPQNIVCSQETRKFYCQIHNIGINLYCETHKEYLCAFCVFAHPNCVQNFRKVDQNLIV